MKSGLPIRLQREISLRGPNLNHSPAARGSEKTRVPKGFQVPWSIPGEFTRRLTLEEDLCRGVNARPHTHPPPSPPLESWLRFLRGELIKKGGRDYQRPGHRKHFTRGTLRPSPVICEIGESTLNYTSCLSFSLLSTADHGRWWRARSGHVGFIESLFETRKEIG